MARGGSRADEKAGSFFIPSAFLLLLLSVLETAHDGHVAHHERSFLYAVTVRHLRLEIF